MGVGLKLGPASPIVRRRHAQSELLPFGRLDEAVHELELAVDVDPLNVHSRAWLMVTLEAPDLPASPSSCTRGIGAIVASE